MFVLSIICGIAAFLMFYLYDWFTVKKPAHSFTKWGFYVAFLLAFGSVVLAACRLFPIAFTPAGFIVSVSFIVLGFAGLMNVLFFTLPKGTYTNPAEKRRVFAGGAYALCRHPGFWPYLLIHVGLVLLFGAEMLIPAVLLCVLNFVYIILQDVWTFKHIFEDYDQYSKEVPFLLPSVKSLTKWSSRFGKE